MNNFYKCSKEVPQESSMKLPAKYCTFVPNPQKDLSAKARLNYDTKIPKKQPDALVMFKSMYNNIVNLDGEWMSGFPMGKALVQNQLLKNLKYKIDKFCE
jgi:hypothetical protein